MTHNRRISQQNCDSISSESAQSCSSVHGHSGTDGSSDATRSYERRKRLFDIIVAGVTLIFISPMMLLIAAAIKLSSPGSVVFEQKRIGQNRRHRNNSNGNTGDRRNGDYRGQPFNIYKFRTMRSDAAPYWVSPSNPDDARFTPVGRLLRRFCLDELPQLFNVLRGDLSLVGPRPEMPFIVKKYTEREAQRLLVKPGITGLWQIKGSRRKFIHENLEHDLEYIARRSFWMDVSILIRTVLFVIGSKNL